MKVVVTGATGNAGTATLRALIADESVTEIVGIARRLPEWQPRKVRWVQADVARDPLAPHFEGADAVVHLAWLIQPSRNERITERVNVHGSRRVFEAAAEAGAEALIHASSVAAYSPADPDQPVDESYPTRGIPSSYYSRQKVAVERILDEIQATHGAEMRICRARPGLIMQRSAASAIRRYFAGPLLPGWAVRRSLIPVVPQLVGLAGQVVHSDDMGELYRLLCVDETAQGAYNVATGPPLDAGALGHLLGAKPIKLAAPVVRAAIHASWLARIHPVSPDWLDVGLNVPVMKTDRARNELGWTPVHDSGSTLLELMEGMRANAGDQTPVLDPHAGGRLRIREVLTGVGGPNPLDRESAKTGPVKQP